MICTGFYLSSCFSPTPYPSNYSFWCSALMVYVIIIIIRAVRNLCIGESLKRELHILDLQKKLGRWVLMGRIQKLLGDTWSVCTSPVFINITHLGCLDLWTHTSPYNVQYLSKQSSLCLHHMFYPPRSHPSPSCNERLCVPCKRCSSMTMRGMDIYGMRAAKWRFDSELIWGCQIAIFVDFSWVSTVSIYERLVYQDCNIKCQVWPC